MDLISTSPPQTSYTAGTLSATAGGDAAALLGTAQDSAATHAATTPSTSASLSPTTAFSWDGIVTSSDEMQTLLSLLPPPEAVGDELAGLGLDLGAVSASEPWAWNGSTDIPISV
jgi:hypothetical protein